MPINQDLEYMARREIYGFINRLYQLLDDLIEGSSNQDFLIRSDMIIPLQSAWKEFKSDFDFGFVEHQIFSTSAATLQDHGLYGEQLKAKVLLFDLRLRDFSLQKAIKALARLLRAADVFLDSILKATFVTGAIKEIKDVLLNSLDE